MKNKFWIFLWAFLFVLGGILLAPLMYVLAYQFWLYTDMAFDLSDVFDCFKQSYLLVVFLGFLLCIFKMCEALGNGK